VIAGGNHLATQVKDNQPKLRRRLELGSQWRRPIELAENRTVGRNRWEMRELKVFPAKAWFRGTPWHSLLNTVLRLDRTVWTRSPATGLLKRTAETVFWVSSAAGRTAAQWLAAIRGHWRIENALHWVLDVTFRDDLSRLRKGHGATNMAIVRHFALNIVRTANDKHSLKTRRKKAGWSDNYLASLLNPTAR
jgi:hypothetical protein